jgi:hypothetical protein
MNPTEPRPPAVLPSPPGGSAVPRPDALPPPPGPHWQQTFPAPGARKPRRALITIVSVMTVLVMVTVAAAPVLNRFVQTSAQDEYRFLETDDSGHPARWNPCEPIHYVVNLGHAPAGSLLDVQEAVQRVSDATGISFAYDGYTDEVPFLHRDPYQPDRYGDQWAPVVIAWTSPTGTDIPFHKNGHVAAGIASPELPYGNTGNVFVSGWVVINVNDPNPPGFDTTGEQGPVVQHELGHIVGMGHAKEQGELMEPSGGGMTDWGPGDLEGLKKLGRGAGCLTTPPVPGG